MADTQAQEGSMVSSASSSPLVPVVETKATVGKPVTRSSTKVWLAGQLTEHLGFEHFR
jgi:hypothetical protein